VETLLIAGGALDPKDGATVSGLRPDWNRLVVELDPGVRALEEVFHR
jgi:hypothetical protein